MLVITLDQYDYEAYTQRHANHDGRQTYWLSTQGYVIRSMPLLCKPAFELLREYLYEVMGRDADYYIRNHECYIDASEAGMWLQYELDVLLFLANAKVVRSAAELEEG